MEQLRDYGWTDEMAAGLEAGERAEDVGRVIQEHKEAYLVRGAGGDVWAEISGRLRHGAVVRRDFPAVGDFVILRGGAAAVKKKAGGPVQIVRILPRKTTLVRRLDSGDEQVLATNVDVAFLGQSMNENFHPRRLERYLALARESGARPVILLTKADLCEDATPFVEAAREVGGAAALHVISVLKGTGLDEVRAYLPRGSTGVILGSSGIGKSTLVNVLADADVQDMMEVREFDDKGRHCTTFRHLVKTTAGGLIIDTPGLRGLALGEATDALAGTFADIEALARVCKFTNCAHATEPGCAIKGAVEGGTLDVVRLESYLKLKREVAGMQARENRIADRKQKKLTKRAAAEAEGKSGRAEKHWRR